LHGANIDERTSAHATGSDGLEAAEAYQEFLQGLDSINQQDQFREVCVLNAEARLLSRSL